MSGGTGQPLRPSPNAASGPGGNIYDLGYRGYDGPRLGRRSAVRALFGQSLRASPVWPSCRPSWPSASRRSPRKPVQAAK